MSDAEGVFSGRGFDEYKSKFFKSFKFMKSSRLTLYPRFCRIRVWLLAPNFQLIISIIVCTAVIIASVILACINPVHIYFNITAIMRVAIATRCIARIISSRIY